MNTDNLVKLITQAIAYKYPTDPMRPGLTVAVLNNGHFYVSVIRHNIEGKVKVVVHKTQSSSLEISLKEIARMLLSEQMPQNPLDMLAKEVAPKIMNHQFDEEEPFPQYNHTWKKSK